MSNVKIAISNRQEGKNPRQVRAEGFITGSIYGKNMEAKSIQLNAHEFEMAYRNNKNAVWELALGKEKFNAKIQELQVNYSTNEYLNVEFLAV